MPTFGSIEFYNPEKEDWNAYIERFDQFKAFLEEALRDRFVCGLSEKFENIQRRLLAEEGLTWKNAASPKPWKQLEH